MKTILAGCALLFFSPFANAEYDGPNLMLSNPAAAHFSSVILKDADAKALYKALEVPAKKIDMSEGKGGGETALQKEGKDISCLETKINNDFKYSCQIHFRYHTGEVLTNQPKKKI